MLFSISELIDVCIMTLGVGFIFQDVFTSIKPKTVQEFDPLKKYQVQGKARSTNTSTVSQYFSSIFSSNLGFAILVTAPAVILHELMHKLVAIGYGLQATFHAAYFWLGLGIILKMLNFGFIFFVPGYVSISGNPLPLQNALIAFAGPGTNLALFAIASLMLKQEAFLKKHRRYIPFLALTKRINGFLFIFNMLPLPIFDGWKVYLGIYHAFF